MAWNRPHLPVGVSNWLTFNTVYLTPNSDITHTNYRSEHGTEVTHLLDFVHYFKLYSKQSAVQINLVLFTCISQDITLAWFFTTEPKPIKIQWTGYPELLKEA